MDSNKKIFWNKAMLWGLFIALATMISTTVYYTSDSMFSGTKQLVEGLILIAGIILCAQAYRATLVENEYFLYKQSLGLGVATSFFASLIIGLFTFILYKYIDPELINQIIINTEEKLMAAGLNDDMIELQIEMQHKLIKPSIMAIGNIFNVTITGLIIALITSIFTQKKPANKFDSAMNEIDN